MYALVCAACLSFEAWHGYRAYIAQLVGLASLAQSLHKAEVLKQPFDIATLHRRSSTIVNDPIMAFVDNLQSL